MNFSGKLDSTPLTTRDALRRSLAAPQVGTWTTEEDTLHDSLIASVSGVMTNYLGRHTLRRERTETYTLRAGRTQLRLDGYPVVLDIADTSGLTIRMGPDFSSLESSDPLDVSVDCSIDPGAGLLSFPSSRPSIRYIHVTYTGGIAGVGDAPTDAPWLSELCVLQCQYLLQRLDKMGASITPVEGMGSVLAREYGLLDHVREVLDAHRKVG